MKIDIARKSDQELNIEIQGEGNTFCNLIESILLEDKDVEFAGYDIPHPLMSNSLITIRTKKGKSPVEALKEAIDKALQRGKEFNEIFSVALENWKKE